MEEVIEMEVEVPELAQVDVSEFREEWVSDTDVDTWEDGVNESESTPCSGLADLGIVSESACEREGIDDDWRDGVSSSNAREKYESNTNNEAGRKWERNWLDSIGG